MGAASVALGDGESKAGAVFVRSRDELVRILDADVNVVVLRRSLPKHRYHAYRRAATQTWEKRAEFDLQNPDAGVRTLTGNIEDREARQYLEEETLQWASCFAHLVDRGHVNGQLSVVSTNMCRKFHTYFVPLRLLCTLVGPATEWLYNADTVRANLARVDVGLDDANRSVVQSGAAVQHAMEGDVLLLKGDAWPGNEGCGAVHRSPPIEAHGERRLELKFDMARCGC